MEEGGTKGKAMGFMIMKPSELLATIFIGNNICHILAGALTIVIASAYFDHVGVALSVVATTTIVIVFGEILPKALGQKYAEKLSLVFIRVLQVVYYLFYPIISGLVWIMQKLVGESLTMSKKMVTKDEIEFMISKAEKERTMDSKQIDLLASILEFPLIKVKDIMIPRMRINYIQSKWSFNEIMDYARETENSRYPVVDGELENIIGFLHLKDLAFLTDEEKKKFRIDDLLKPPFFVYEHMKIQSVFDHMNRKKVHLALVKDENGTVVGVVTLEDIIEEVLGDIQDEHDDEEDLKEEQSLEDLIEDGILVEGDISLRDLYNDYDIKIPLNDNYSTLAGFVLDMLGNSFPEQEQMIIWEGYSFNLELVEDHVIKEVRIKDVDGEKHFFSKKEHAELVEKNDLEAVILTNQENE